MKPPCEIVVWYVIPAIRSELAKDLLALGMKQKDVSELMDITQPAVSQYITDKRGSGIELSPNVKEMVKELDAKKHDLKTLLEEIDNLRLLARKQFEEAVFDE